MELWSPIAHMYSIIAKIFGGADAEEFMLECWGTRMGIYPGKLGAWDGPSKLINVFLRFNGRP